MRKWYRTMKKNRWWKNLLLTNEACRLLVHESARYALDSSKYAELAGRIARLRKRLRTYGSKLGLSDAALELPFARSRRGELPALPVWL